jgi:hypothetical protein
MLYREILYRLYHDLETLYGDYRDANLHHPDLRRAPKHRGGPCERRRTE